MRYFFRLMARRLLFLAAFYFVLRLLFFIYNHSLYAGIAPADILSAFWLGLRFDVSTLLKLNGFFLFIWLVPHRLFHEGRLAKFVFALFLGVNSLFLILNVVDFELVHFSGQRLTLNYFATAQDINNQIGQLIFYYWPLTLLSLILCFLFVRFFPRAQFAESSRRPFPKIMGPVIACVCVFLFALGVRGGFQNKPLRSTHAFRYSRGELGNLALNSTFTLLQSGRGVEQKKIRLVSEDQIRSYLNRDRSSHFHGRWSRPQNVVILIMESFALEFIGEANGGKGYTPFIDSLSKKGLFFKNAFANGRRSLEAVPSILASVPSLLSNPFLTSNFQGTKILGLGELLKNRGYHTAFFHGAENGSMFFDSFAFRAGFSGYYGLHEYPHRERDYDGFWGILDEPFFLYSLEKINEFKKPFAAVIFSLSSHQPYHVPVQYKGQFPKGTLDIHESIGYADYALKKFFAEAERQDWYKDTLFIITADHTQKSDKADYQDDLGVYRVPLILYHPALTGWPNHEISRVVQHADILPTVVDVLDIKNTDLSLVGSSVFSSKNDAFVVNRTLEGFWYLSSDYLLRMDFNFNLKSFRHFDTRRLTPLSKDEVPQNEELRFKAYLQYFINGVMENKLSLGVLNPAPHDEEIDSPHSQSVKNLNSPVKK